MKFKEVYQFKISLKWILPIIWRRIQVPANYTFWDLHVAIQDVMGWTDSHLHRFEIINPATEKKEEIGIPDNDFDGDVEIIPGWQIKLKDYFNTENRQAEYIYDFGDNWEHFVELEAILPREPKTKYPRCLVT